MRFTEYISAPNSSHGFHQYLFNYIDKYRKRHDTLLLIAEPEEVIPIFLKNFDSLKVDTIDYSGKRGEEFTDFNFIRDFDWQYDYIFCQATLEHVCRPSIFIENLANFTVTGGHIIIHTHNPHMPYHAWPIDCVRFFKDFFYDLERYLPLKVSDYREDGAHICMAYERL